MVLISHNTDFGDACNEREEDDPTTSRVLDIAYAVGVNVLCTR